MKSTTTLFVVAALATAAFAISQDSPPASTSFPLLCTTGAGKRDLDEYTINENVICKRILSNSKAAFSFGDLIEYADSSVRKYCSFSSAQWTYGTANTESGLSVLVNSATLPCYINGTAIPNQNAQYNVTLAVNPNKKGTAAITYRDRSIAYKTGELFFDLFVPDLAGGARITQWFQVYWDVSDLKDKATIAQNLPRFTSQNRVYKIAGGISVEVSFDEFVYISTSFPASTASSALALSLEGGSSQFSSQYETGSATFAISATSTLANAGDAYIFIDPAVNLDQDASSRSSSAVACFVATAAFGSPSHVAVNTLRAVRDNVLLTSTVGRAFVDAYYSVSPAVADLIATNDFARAAVRAVLHPLVALSSAF